jgi:alginate biosynthesis protein Alg44
MTQTPPQIVHESETQRQHVRLQLPAMVDIQGIKYHVKDLSSGGVAVRDIDVDITPGKQTRLSLLLPFNDFTLDVTVSAQVQYVDKARKIIGCRFVDLNPGQIAILNHVIKAYIAGDIVGGGDILNVASRDNFVSVRKHKTLEEKTAPEKAKVYAIYGGVVLAVLALASFIFSNILERTLILKAPNGVIETQIVEISAFSPGTFDMTLPAGVMSVKAGQKIGTLSRALEDKVVVSDTGEVELVPQNTVTDIKSPCDCFVSRQVAQNGQYKAEGALLVELVPQKGEVHISALVPTKEVHRLKIGTTARMTVAGTRTEITGKITDIKTSEKTVSGETQEPSAPASRVVIKPDTGISMDQLGRPVMVEFDL